MPQVTNTELQNMKAGMIVPVDSLQPEQDAGRQGFVAGAAQAIGQKRAGDVLKRGGGQVSPRELDLLRRYAPAPAPAEPPVQPEPTQGVGYGSLITEPAKSLVRGTAQTAQAVTGGGTEAVGRLLAGPDIVPQRQIDPATFTPPAQAPPGTPADLAPFLTFEGGQRTSAPTPPNANPFAGARQVAENVFGPVSNAEMLQENPQVTDATLLSGAGPTAISAHYLSKAGSAIPFMAPVMGASALGGASGGAGMAALIVGSETYDKNVAEGVPEQESLRRAAVSSGLTHAVFAIPLARATKFLPKPLQTKLTNILAHALDTGAKLPALGGVDAAANIETLPRSFDDWRDSLTRIANGVYEARDEAIVGLLLGGAGGAMSRSPKGKAEIPAEQTKAAGETAKQLLLEYFPPVDPLAEKPISQAPQAPAGVDRAYPPLDAGPGKKTQPDPSRLEPMGKEYAPPLPEAGPGEPLPVRPRPPEEPPPPPTSPGRPTETPPATPPATISAEPAQTATKGPRASVSVESKPHKEIAAMLPPEVARYSEADGRLDFDPTFEGTSKVRDAMESAIENSNLPKAKKMALLRASDKLMDRIFAAQEKVNPTREPSGPMDITPAKGKDKTEERGAVNLNMLIAPAKGAARLLSSKPPTWRHLFGFTPETAEGRKVVIKREGRLNSLYEQIRQINRDMRRGATKAHGLKTALSEIPEAERKIMGDYLREPDAAKKQSYLEKLPEPMREAAVHMRNFIDSLSRKLVGTGMVKGELADVIESKDGFYVRETYKIFSDPKWKEGIPEQVKEEVRQYIRTKEPTLGDTGVNQRLNQYMSIGDYPNTTPADVVGKVLGTTNLTSLTGKWDVPEPLKKLWGVERDGVRMFTETASRMSRMYADMEFAKNLIDVGNGKWLWTPEAQVGADKSNAPGPYSRAIYLEKHGRGKTLPLQEILESPSGSIATMLQNVKVLPEVKQALEDAVATHSSPQLLKEIAAVNTLAKVIKTTWNPTGQMRNNVSSFLLNAFNGHSLMGSAKEKARRYRMAEETVFGSIYGYKNEEVAALRREIVEEGVAMESTFRELRELKKDARGAYISQAVNAMGRGLPKEAREALSRLDEQSQLLYLAGDDLYRSYAYIAEKEGLMKAGYTEAQARAEAAQEVRDRYPTYSENAKALQAFRYNPFFASFTGWVSAIPRAAWNNYASARRRIASDNPEIRKMGYAQAMGIAGAAAGPVAVSAATAMLVGIKADDGEDDDLRRFMAPWDQKGSPAWRSLDRKTGKFTFINQSYSEPLSVLRDPVRAFMNEDNMEDAIKAMAWSVAEPYLSEEIAFKQWDEVRHNLTREGKPIWNEADTAGEKAQKQLMHVLEAYNSPFLRDVLKARNADKPGTVIAGAITGQKTVEVSIPQTLEWKARAYMKLRSAGVADVWGAMRNEDPKDLKEQQRQLEALRKKAFDSIREDYLAADRIMDGGTALLRQSLKEGGIPEKDIPFIITGNYQPWKPTDKADVAKFNRLRRQAE